MLPDTEEQLTLENLNLRKGKGFVPLKKDLEHDDWCCSICELKLKEPHTFLECAETSAKLVKKLNQTNIDNINHIAYLDSIYHSAIWALEIIKTVPMYLITLNGNKQCPECKYNFSLDTRHEDCVHDCSKNKLRKVKEQLEVSITSYKVFIK